MVRSMLIVASRKQPLHRQVPVLQRATLGGVQGVADLQSRARSEIMREWRGTFVFRADDEDTIAHLVEQAPTTVFETDFEGERRKLSVRVLSFTTSGLAFFEGSGEPT